MVACFLTISGLTQKKSCRVEREQLYVRQLQFTRLYKDGTQKGKLFHTPSEVCHIRGILPVYSAICSWIEELNTIGMTCKIILDDAL